MRAKLIILMILIILFTIFVVQNTEPVSLQVFFWHVAELPKIILLTVTLVIGVILGFIISTVLNKHKNNEKNNLKPFKSVTSIEREKNNK